MDGFPVDRTRLFVMCLPLSLLMAGVNLMAAETVSQIFERLSPYRDSALEIDSDEPIKRLEQGIYEGGFVNSKPHGQGILLYDDDRVYQGSFSEGVREGYGALTWANGDEFQGMFFGDEMTGLGEISHKATGERYKGFFLNGLKQGSGEYEWLDGRKYVGSFHEDAKEGRGDFLRSNGSIYRGYYADDELHGEGVLFTVNGAVEYQRWNGGRLLESIRVQLTENCRLQIEGRLWMFKGDNCINGLAHGKGLAVRSDGLAYISNAEIVLGQLVSGVKISLTPLKNL
ncbi:MAG: hypothetical protein OXC80_07595 [Gammaproteobacteria bacterium]|nr:hypothetical protein [Gammaproteobacteria bacterium]